MLRRTSTLLAAAIALSPATTFAAPKWDNQQNEGAPGKVTYIDLYSPGSPFWTQLRGVVKIGDHAYQWGGSSCETDLTSPQIAALSLAMVQGFTVTPTYRSVTNANTRCLVSFNFRAP